MAFLWVKVLHLVSMVSWFAGMLYIWRLYVYHNQSEEDSVRDQLSIMEKKLYYIIMYPAGIFTIGSGLYMLMQKAKVLHQETWFMLKLLLVLILIIQHFLAGYYRKALLKNKRYPKYFFRIVNEIPTLLLIGIITLTIIRPF